MKLEPLEDRALLAVGFGHAFGIGSSGQDFGVDITTDASGNAYVTGSFEGTVDFDPGPGVTNLTSVGTSNIFVAKYTPTGALVWARGMGGNGFEGQEGSAVDLDSAGNVIIAGSFHGTGDFDPGPGTFNLSSTGRSSPFIAKLDPNGNFLWAGAIVGGTAAFGLALAVDSLDNIHVAGAFAGTADFDPGPGTFELAAPLLPGRTSPGAFILKLDSGGDFVWADAFSGTGENNRAFGIALDTAGNVYATGDFSGTTDFDPGPGTFNLTGGGGSDAWILKLSNSGDFVWARILDSSTAAKSSAIAVDSAANVYTTGGFLGTMDFDPGPGTFNLTSAGSVDVFASRLHSRTPILFDVFVSKLDTNGNFVWGRAMGGTGNDFAFALALDSSSNVYTIGSFSSATATADFDPGPGTFNLGSADSFDEFVFVSKLDSDGNFLSALSMGGTGASLSTGITLDGSNNIYTTGAFIGTADFDPGPATFNLSSADSFDIFVSKLTVNPVNDAPVALNDRFVLSQAPASAASSVEGVLSNDADVDLDGLAAILVNGPADGSVALNLDGSFSYTPGSDFLAIDRFSYRAGDGQATSQTATVTLVSYEASLVRKLYLQVLGREPEDSGWHFWTRRILNGEPMSIIAEGIFESNERLNPIVSQYYRDFLLREPEPQGLAFWRDQVWKRDGGPENVVAGMIGSPEFFRSASGTNRGWVTELYRRLLSREPEPSGLQFWEEALNQNRLTREQVVLGFVRSDENFRNLVTGWYQQYLERMPSADDRGALVALMRGGASHRAIQILLIDSLEYRNSPPPPAAGTATRLL